MDLLCATERERETQESDQQSSEGEEADSPANPWPWGSGGETFRHRKKSRSACRKAQNRRELLNQRGRHQLHNGGIPSHCCRTNAGMSGKSRPTWPSFQDTVRGRRGDHNEKVSAGKIRQSCRLVGGMIGCYMFPLLSDMVLYEVTFTRCPAAGLACIPQAANLQLD